jgi:hypothetical protein
MHVIIWSCYKKINLISYVTWGPNGTVVMYMMLHSLIDSTSCLCLQLYPEDESSVFL